MRELLQRKIGPVPVWVIAVGVAVLAFVFITVKRRNGKPGNDLAPEFEGSELDEPRTIRTSPATQPNAPAPQPEPSQKQWTLQQIRNIAENQAQQEIRAAEKRRRKRRRPQATTRREAATGGPPPNEMVPVRGRPSKATLPYIDAVGARG